MCRDVFDKCLPNHDTPTQCNQSRLIEMLGGKELRVFMLNHDEDYDYQGETIHLSIGDTFTGGKACNYPGARDYSVVRDQKRIWFAKDVVENSPERFSELFT